MLYKFKSKAAGDLIMLEPHGRQVLGIMGKEPDPTGIITTDQMPAAIAALEAAIGEPEGEDHEVLNDERVSLRQRAFPMLEMLRRCLAAGKDIVWGV